MARVDLLCTTPSIYLFFTFDKANKQAVRSVSDAKKQRVPLNPKDTGAQTFSREVDD